MVALELFTEFSCCVVFLGADLKERYYKGALGVRSTAMSMQARH